MPSASAILTKNKSTFVSAPSPLTQTGVDQRWDGDPQQPIREPITDDGENQQPAG